MLWCKHCFCMVPCLHAAPPGSWQPGRAAWRMESPLPFPVLAGGGGTGGGGICYIYVAMPYGLQHLAAPHPASLLFCFLKIKQAQDEERRQLIQLRDILKSALQVEQKEVRGFNFERLLLYTCVSEALGWKNVTFRSSRCSQFTLGLCQASTKHLVGP